MVSHTIPDLAVFMHVLIVLESVLLCGHRVSALTFWGRLFALGMLLPKSNRLLLLT
jgi:hypothetical protein